MCFHVSQADLRMLEEPSAGTDGGRRPCDVSCGERVALIPEAGMMEMEVDSRPPLCEGACLRPVHDPALQTERGEAHRMTQVPFLLNTGPEAQGPTPQCSRPVSVLAILCPGPCKGLAGEDASISGDAQNKGGRERLALGTGHRVPVPVRWS